MKVRVIDKPCLFAETVYLLYYYINGIAYTRDYERVNRKFGRYLLEKEDQGLQLAQELDRISAAVTQTLDPHQARLRYFFEKLPGTDEKTCCCLAHTMLVATPLNCTDIDSFAAELLRMFRYMSGIVFKINDMNTMGLVLEPLDPQEEPEPLQVQLERLPCSMEARWEILRVLTEFETYLRELTELLRPVAEQLAVEMQALTERNRAQLAIWEKYFQTHSVETVVMLSHKKPDSVINVKVEFGEGEGKVPLDNIAKRAEAYKPKERVTYKMIKEYIEAKYGFKVHTAYIAEVKRDLGLPMYDAPNAVEELKQPRKHPTPEKVEAIKDALKHFEVI